MTTFQLNVDFFSENSRFAIDLQWRNVFTANNGGNLYSYDWISNQSVFHNNKSLLLVTLYGICGAISVWSWFAFIFRLFNSNSCRVNFTNIYKQLSWQFSYAKTVQSQSSITKSCVLIFFTKAAHKMLVKLKPGFLRFRPPFPLLSFPLFWFPVLSLPVPVVSS